MCDTRADAPLGDFAAGTGQIDTGDQPEADESWYGRIAWGTADGPLTDPSPTHEAHA